MAEPCINCVCIEAVLLPCGRLSIIAACNWLSYTRCLVIGTLPVTPNRFHGMVKESAQNHEMNLRPAIEQQHCRCRRDLSDFLLRKGL